MSAEGRGVDSEKRAKIEQICADVDKALADGVSEMVFQVCRRPKPNATQLRVFPGVMGRLVQWGDGTWTMPSVVFVKTTAMHRFAVMARRELAAAPAAGGEGEAG